MGASMGRRRHSSPISSAASFTYLGRSTGSPAPEMITSAPAFTASFTYRAYSFVATMILKPRIPSGAVFLAFLSSSWIALRLAPMGSFKKSGSLKPIWAVEMIPIPPAFATAPARDERLIPTPMPPWITGYSAVSGPIFNGFNCNAASPITPSFPRLTAGLS